MVESVELTTTISGIGGSDEEPGTAQMNEVLQRGVQSTTGTAGKGAGSARLAVRQGSDQSTANGVPERGIHRVGRDHLQRARRQGRRSGGGAHGGILTGFTSPYKPTDSAIHLSDMPTRSLQRARFARLMPHRRQRRPTHFHMSLTAKQDALIEDLNFLPDPQERLAELVRRGTRHSLPDSLKTPDRRVPGCVSGVWVEKSIDPISSLPVFLCDADSPMVKGLAALLCDLYSGGTPAEILCEEPRLWEACGLHKLLSPTRLNGLGALRERIKQLAGV